MAEETIDELREKMGDINQFGKQKFTTKVHHLLSYTSKYPKAISITGIAWLPDGKNFVCHSKILGNFLKLRANSINTNFREHHFEIIDTYPKNNLVLYFGRLVDLCKWNVRKQTKYPWSNESTLFDAEMIKPKNRNKTETIIAQPPLYSSFQMEFKLPLSILPLCTASLLSDDVDQMISIAKQVRRMMISDGEKTKFLSVATQDWIFHFGKVLSIPRTTLVQSFLNQEEADDENYDQLFTNIEFLLVYRQNPSQGSSDISFEEYVVFLARYGPHAKVYSNVFALSDVPYFYFDVFSSQEKPRPHFKPWFNPYLDCRLAENKLKSQSKECWIIRHSTNIDTFSLHSKINSSGVCSITSTHIWYKVAATSENQRFNVVLNCNNIFYGTTLEEILFHVMKLNVDDSLNIATLPIQQETRMVDADFFIQRRSFPKEQI